MHSPIDQIFSPIIKCHGLSINFPQQTQYNWTVEKIEPFNELLLSWNAERPLNGHYVILSSVYYQDRWSPWLLYAVWGTHYQYSFHDTHPSAPARSFQDQIELLEGQIATGFRVRIEACAGANLKNFYTLYACPSKIQSLDSIKCIPPHSSISLSMTGLSQIQLNHPRSMSLCSPTSTTAFIHHALGNRTLSPLQFAQSVYDAGFDIYGNWTFNIAQAYVELGFSWHCFCARAEGFQAVWHSLRMGIPVIVSIKGKLNGSLKPYPNGHLVVIRGYDAISQQVLCMDPAFDSDNETIIAYPWEEFIQAWKNRGYLTYFFSNKNIF